MDDYFWSELHQNRRFLLRTCDSCCEKITLYEVKKRGSLISVLQWLSCQHRFKQMFSTCSMSFCFFWHPRCMHTSTLQLTGKVVNIVKSPYFSTLKRVIFSQHASCELHIKIVLKKKRKQADSNILGNTSGIIGLAKDYPGVPKDPKT